MALVSPRGIVPSDAPKLRLYTAPCSLERTVQGAFAFISDKLPFQCLLSAPYDWRLAIGEARREMGPFDVTVVLLSRLHPWIHKSLEGRTVLDAVDSLRRSAEERRKAAGPVMRWIWRTEERRMARVELDAASSYGVSWS